MERWDVDTPANSLALRFQNFASLLMTVYGSDLTQWHTHTLSSIVDPSRSEKTFTLYRRGALLGTYSFGQLSSGIATTPGPHEIRSSSTYSVAGAPGS